MKRVLLALSMLTLLVSISWGWSAGIQLAVVDETWGTLQDLISRQYPNRTLDWGVIGSYAYGGVVAADKDFYILINTTKDYLFTDLSHELLSGDLINTMRAQAKTPEETAFAWGWMIGCLADQIGHPNFVNYVAGWASGTNYLTIPGNEPMMGKVKLFLDGYWLPERDRQYSFAVDLMNRSLTAVYGFSWANDQRFFNPAPQPAIINLALHEFRKAWPNSNQRKHTTRGGIPYKIMTQANRLSLTIQLTYPASKFQVVENTFNANRDANEKMMFGIFYKIVDTAVAWMKNPSAPMPNLTMEMGVAPLEDGGYAFSVRGLRGWMRWGSFEKLTPERANLLKAYKAKYVP